MLMAAVVAHVWLLRAPDAPVPDAGAVATAPVAAPRTAAPAEPAVSLEHREVVPNIIEEEKAAPGGVIPSLPPLGPTRIALRDGDEVLPASIEPEAISSPDLPRKASVEAAYETDAVVPAVVRALREQPVDLAALPRTMPVAPPPPAVPEARDTVEKPRGAPATARTANPATLDEDRQLVLQTVQEYTRAYERLDVRAAKAVWPSLDERELKRAFQGLEAQQIRMSCGRVSIEGQGANARCSGEATYRPKFGSRVLHLTQREWTFSFSRSDSGWQIADVIFQ